MKEFITNILSILLFAYIISSFVYFMGGFTAYDYKIIDGQHQNLNHCFDHPENSELFFPTYKLGCWLRAPQGEKYYWERK